MTDTSLTSFAEELRGLGAYRLANEADCACPDAPDSAGALFLDSVRDDLIEAIEYLTEEPETVDQLRDLLEDSVHEIADAAPDVYTGTRWAEFVDLAAYQEDLSELGEVDPDDLTASVAGVALYIIAERLVHALIGLYEPEEDDDDLDDESA